MKIILVAGGTPAWRNSGWGHALIGGGAKHVLVSFLEFSKDGRQSIEATGMDPSYTPKVDEPKAVDLGPFLTPPEEQ